jgi:hypothetical protein
LNRSQSKNFGIEVSSSKVQTFGRGGHLWISPQELDAEEAGMLKNPGLEEVRTGSG